MRGVAGGHLVGFPSTSSGSWTECGATAPLGPLSRLLCLTVPFSRGPSCHQRKRPKNQTRRAASKAWGSFTSGKKGPRDKAGPQGLAGRLARGEREQLAVPAGLGLRCLLAPGLLGAPATGPLPSLQAPGPAYQGGKDPIDGGLPGALTLTLVFFPSNLGADVIAEIGLEELNGLEMEIMRRQVSVGLPGSHAEGGGRGPVPWGRRGLDTRLGDAQPCQSHYPLAVEVTVTSRPPFPPPSPLGSRIYPDAQPQPCVSPRDAGRKKGGREAGGREDMGAQEKLVLKEPCQDI